MTDKIAVFVTGKNPREMKRIARHLLEKRLIACANLLPAIESLYHWNGKVANEKESWMVLKTSRELFAPLQTEIEKLHTSQTPEIIALPIIDGSANYLNWITDS